MKMCIRDSVYVHADEFIGELGVKIAGKLHRVGKRFFAMIDGVLNTLTQRLGNARHGLGAKRAPDGVSAERQRQSRNFLPPSAEIDQAVQSRFVVG